MKKLTLILLILLIGSIVFAQKPIADFEVKVKYECGYATTEFINRSQNATKFLWDQFGSNYFKETSAPRGTRLTTDRTWTVTLIAINNTLSDTISKEISVIQTRPKFEIKKLDDNIYKFENLSYVRPGDNLTYSWDFFDGTNSILKNPIHIFKLPEFYIIKLDAIKNNECTLHASGEIEIVDTAQISESKFIITDCLNSTHSTEINYKIINDSVNLSGFYYANCGTEKIATFQNLNDTIFIKTWECGADTTCSCIHFFDITVPYNNKDTMIISFNGKILSDAKTVNKDIITNNINIYPNPITNIINIENLELKDNFSFEILDIQGNIRQSGSLKSNQSIKIDKQQIKNGMYILCIRKNNNINYLKKILIQ